MREVAPGPEISVGRDRLYAQQHELHAFCACCEWWSVIDLEGMIRAGYGERGLPITVRCRDCGEAGMLQVRPPMQTQLGSTGMA